MLGAAVVDGAGAIGASDRATRAGPLFERSPGCLLRIGAAGSLAIGARAGRGAAVAGGGEAGEDGGATTTDAGG